MAITMLVQCLKMCQRLLSVLNMDTVSSFLSCCAFGLIAPSSFIGLLKDVFHEYLVFVDVILVNSTTFEEHSEKLQCSMVCL